MKHKAAIIALLILMGYPTVAAAIGSRPRPTASPPVHAQPFR